MKKILSLLTLLLCVCSGAWAQTTLISYTVDEVTSATAANTGEWTDRDATGTPGGTCSFYLKWGWKSDKLDSGKGWFRDGSNSRKVYTIGGADGSIKLSLANSETFKNGDVVSVTYNSSNNNSTGYYVRTDYKVSTNQLTSDATTTGSTWQTKEVTLTENFEQNTIYIERTGSTMNIYSVTVTRPAAKTNWDEPTIIYEYNGSTGKYDVTITGEEGATLTYKIGAEGAEQAYSATFAVDPSVTVYAKASGIGYEASDWASVEIPAIPAVAAPSYKIGPWDYENNGYAVTLTCPDAEASYVYMTTGSNAEGSTLDWSGATACTNGQVIYVRGYRVAIKGTRIGYTSGYDPTGSRYQVNGVTPTGISPEVVVQNGSGNSGAEADVDHGNKAVSIAANHYAGKPNSTNDNYMKMRVKPNGQSNNQLKIDVKDGYVVTKISFDKIQANTDNAIPVSSVTVDGEALDGFTTFDIPASSSAALENKEISLGSGATSSVVFNFGSTSASQYNATITVTYELYIPGPSDPQPAAGDAITWDFTGYTSKVSMTSGATYSYTADDSSTEMRYTAGSSDEITANKYLKEAGATSNGSYKDVDKTTAIGKNRLIRLFVTGKGTLTINCEKDGSNGIGVYTIYQGNSTNTAASGSALVTGYTANTTTETLTVTNGLWIETTTKGYITSIVWTPASDDIILTTTDNMDGWRTFYDASNNYSVDGNTTVYVAASNPSEGKITLTSIDGVPAGVPVILKTSADNHKMTLTKAAADTYTYTGTNKLAVTTAAAVSDVYRLGYGDSGVGFYPYSGTPGAGIVYLNVSSASSARALIIDFEDETTGITDNKRETITNSGEYFNLAGQRVAQPTKGLYIVGGKKVVIR